MPDLDFRPCVCTGGVEVGLGESSARFVSTSRPPGFAWCGVSEWLCAWDGRKILKIVHAVGDCDFLVGRNGAYRLEVYPDVSVLSSGSKNVYCDFLGVGKFLHSAVVCK